MTKVICISDTHSRHQDIIIPDGDILIHAGDYSMMGYMHEVVPFIEWYKNLKPTHKILISGNHDGIVPKKQPNLMKEMCKDAGIIYLENETTIIEGLKIFGSPITPTFGNWFFMKQRGPQIRRYWNQIEEGTDIVITHGPPMGFLDEVPGYWGTGQKPGEHVGCQDLQDIIFKIKPQLHVFGHIHIHGQKTVEFNGTKFVNASICNEQYKPVNKPMEIEL